VNPTARPRGLNLRAASRWKTYIPLALIAVGLLLLSKVIKLHWLTDFVIFFILALSFDLLYGYMGHLSFGHMLYYGAGAYGTALFLVKASHNPVAALLTGVAVAALLSAVLGLVVMRTHGASFALINMALNQIGYFVIQSPLSNFTHGEDGLSSNAGKLFGVINLYDDWSAFILVGIMLLLVFAFLQALTTSPFGLLVRSLKENERRVAFVGYDTFRAKWITFVIASTLAALAGGLFTLVRGFVSPLVISPLGNVDVIFAVLIGGAGNLYGALIGGTLLMLIKDFLPVVIPEVSKVVGVNLPQWEMWLGLILLIIVFSVRQGVVGVVRSRWQSLLHARRAL
jgi:branched-chain amino acid transport system permease protein